MNIIVTIDQNKINLLKEIESKMTRLGISITNSMDFGIIFGNYDKDNIEGFNIEDRLKNIDGVVSVEKELNVQLPPRDSFLQ